MEKLKKVYSEYKIANSSIFAILYNQRSNFQQAGHLLVDDKQWINANCAAHCLQLCAIEGFGISAVTQALAAAKALHHSAQATEELQKRQDNISKIDK